MVKSRDNSLLFYSMFPFMLIEIHLFLLTKITVGHTNTDVFFKIIFGIFGIYCIFDCDNSNSATSGANQEPWEAERRAFKYLTGNLWTGTHTHKQHKG